MLQFREMTSSVYLTILSQATWLVTRYDIERSNRLDEQVEATPKAPLSHRHRPWLCHSTAYRLYIFIHHKW